ncbi:MAG: hypothetical protein ACLPSW_05445 [Roseiarcus sp.]
MISEYLHFLILIFGVISIPLLVTFLRLRYSKTSFDATENDKLRLDIATLVPISVLLWNLCIYYLAKTFFTPAAAGSLAQPAATSHLTFEAAIAAAGEGTVALATVIIFCRLCGAIWKDVTK